METKRLPVHRAGREERREQGRVAGSGERETRGEEKRGKERLRSRRAGRHTQRREAAANPELRER